MARFLLDVPRFVVENDTEDHRQRSKTTEKCHGIVKDQDRQPNEQTSFDGVGHTRTSAAEAGRRGAWIELYLWVIGEIYAITA